MHWLKVFFVNTKSQRKGIYLLFIIFFLWSLIRYTMPYFINTEIPKTDTSFFATLRIIQEDTNQSSSYVNFKNQEITEEEAVAQLHLHTFNPNEIDSNEFITMGFRPKLVHTILNARRKKWHFYNAASFEKMYGLYPKEFEKIAPFISIPKENNNAPSNSFTKTAYQKPSIKTVELNSCDTTLLIQLPMIGSKLANNIINYRARLGQYAAVEQLLDVYGLQPETFTLIKPYIKVDASHIQKINLNEATYEELRKHPYMQSDILNAIINLRKAKKYHFDSLNQLKEIDLINDETFRKIAYYFEVK